VVSAPAINKLGSLFNSLNKTVTGALNTFITQQQQQQLPQSPGSWQPVGGPQFDHQQHLQHPQQTVQQFPSAHLPHAAPVVPAAAVVVPRHPPPPPTLQAPQRPPGAPHLPSDASSAFVRVGPAVDWPTRPQHPPPHPDYHHGPSSLHNHVPQLPPVVAAYSTQFPPRAGETHRDAARNHVEPRTHLAAAGRGKLSQQY